jgi:NhaP-type Na+/H+ or K+/H+ antiporter
MEGTVVLLVIFAGYALVARGLDRIWISGPMVFVASGLALGPEGAGLLELSLDSEVVLTFTEITLAALLFADATSVPLRAIEADAGVPGRLLSVGLLLTIAAGTVLGLAIVPDLGWAGAALIASVLAPTDAALGMAVVTDRAVPVRVRRALNIESGLNDGIATPFVTVFLAALLSEEGLEGGSWVAEAAIELGLAIVVAVVVGGLGGRLLSLAAQRGWTSSASEQFFVLVVAILAYVGAVEIGGNGFVSAFTAGLVFGAAGGARRREAIGFTEDASLFASFVVWVIFGASFVGPVLAGPMDATFVVYALLSLTVIRMAPVAIALIGKGFGGGTVGFMGWFGPRGLASVVFTLLAVEELVDTSIDLPLFEVATWTILLSVVLHGLSARPLAAAYGSWIGSGDPSAPELVDVPEPRVWRHHLKS